MLSLIMVVNDFSPPCRHPSKAKPMPYRLSLTLLLVLGVLTAAAPRALADPPAQAQPILTVDQVVVGMKGYGMTVFHGTTIEPFSVEVVSINANETPNRSVVWVRCTDERMIHTGPVQGMSGSPIYLWADGEEQTPGQGGRLIGAFAFGYGETNECIVGVQPIQYMREVGQRATAEQRPELSMAAPHGQGLALMTNLYQSSLQLDVSELTRARLGLSREIYQHLTPGAVDDELLGAHTMVAGPGSSGQAMRMMVPMAVGSEAIAQALAPTLMPLGVQPFAADPSALGGTPPNGFDVSNVQLEPGSALVVPFAWGDADLSGAGTVTDVLPDGTVLGFGHAMDGIGVTAIPMATGYVHFIVSLRTISYKRSGTLALQGAIIQDEQSAVAGTSATPYTSAPVHVDVLIEGQPEYEYDYQVLNHPTMTAPIAAAVVSQSTMAVQGPPARHTVHYNFVARFSSGHEITINSAEIGLGGQGAALNMAQLVGAMTQNTLEPVTLESLNATIDIDYGFDAFQIMSARLDRATAQPGETVTVTLELLGLYEQVTTRSFDVQIPEDMPDGETTIMLADAATYTQAMLQTHPHLTQINSLDDLARAYNAIFSADPQTLYALIQTPRLGLALNGQELPAIPASRAVVLANNNPSAQAFRSVQTEEHPMGRIIMGAEQLQLTIQRERGTR